MNVTGIIRFAIGNVITMMKIQIAFLISIYIISLFLCRIYAYYNFII